MTARAALLAKLRTSGLNVHDGAVDVDEAQKVILVPLPYVVFSSGLGYDIDERQGGLPGGRAVPFRIAFVGMTGEQAEAAGEKARSVLSRKRVTISGKETGLIRVVDSDEVRRDDDFTAPGGAPIYRGVDVYEVGV